MPKQVFELARERGMESADVLAELKASGHESLTASSSVDERDAVRALDVGVRLIRLERNGVFVGAAYVKGDTDFAAYARAKNELKITPEHTHATITLVGLVGDAALEESVPRDKRDRLLSPSDLDELERSRPAGTSKGRKPLPKSGEMI